MPQGRTRSDSSEVEAYLFIRDNLRDLGWDTRNPARYPAGQVYTQTQCLAHPEIKRYLGLERPENVVKVNDSIFWVIEAKRDRSELDRAVREAKAYAEKINRSSVIAAKFVSGVAGNDADSYLVQTYFRSGRTYRPIAFNGKDISSLISPEIAFKVLTDGPLIDDVPVSESFFLLKAERINEILHAGAINKNFRARVMAALLLALVDNTPPNIDAAPTVLIGDINNRVRSVLSTQGKPEFVGMIEIALPPTQDNHLKFKAAIVQTLQELNNLNIRSAMNSGTDVLGKFYEVFLKYGNGAKEIGIVLTPRHITKFAVDAVGVSDRDIVYDPTCGTGGFLVSAFDAVKRSHSTAQVNRFKQNGLFGVEQDPDVVALAIVNMIFRGDGKTHIVEGSCFQRRLIRAAPGTGVTAELTLKDQAGEGAATRVLMNPPFALPSAHEKEFHFVDRALAQMQDGGILFSVLPYPAMVKQSVYKEWRLALLRQHTLLAVMTFPDDLFYPIGVHTVGIFVKKGIPQPAGQNVLWLRALHDGMLKSKGKRLPSRTEPNDFAALQDTLQAFLQNPGYPVANIEQLQKACPVDFSDPMLELVPENYLDQAVPTQEEIRRGGERIIRNSISYLVQAGGEYA